MMYAESERERECVCAVCVCEREREMNVMILFMDHHGTIERAQLLVIGVSRWVCYNRCE